MSAQWSDIVVDAGKKLPAVCLKCGAKKDIVRRKETLVAASASQGLGAVGGVCGVMAARAMREDPVAAAFVVGACLAGSLAVGIIVHRQSPKVELALPLCGACNAKWDQGITVRRAILAALCFAGVAFAYGFFAHDTTGYVVGGMAMGAIVIAALAFRLRDRFVYAFDIRGTTVSLRGVCDDARGAIVVRTARKKK